MTFDLDTATASTTFSVFDFVTGAALPEDDYTVYTDGNAALKLAKIFTEEAARREAAKEDSYAGIADEPVADEETITALHEALVKSALVFRMRGLSPNDLAELEDSLKTQTGYAEGADNENYFTTLNNTLVAKSIQHVTNAAGAVDNNKWTAAMVKSFVKSVYTSEGNKLYTAAAELSYVGAIFDGVVNADFS